MKHKNKLFLIGFNDYISTAIAYILMSELDYELITITGSKDTLYNLENEKIIFDLNENSEIAEYLSNAKSNVCIINCLMLDEQMSQSKHLKNSYFKYIEYLNSLKYKFDNYKIIHISSYRVFSGQEKEYFEESLRDAKDDYGKFLIKIEDEILKNGNNLVVRYSKIFSSSSKADTIVKKLYQARNDNKFIANNIRYNPLYINDLAYFLSMAIIKNTKGIFHAGSTDYVNEYDFACELAKIMELDLSYIITSKSNELNYCLNSNKSYIYQIFEFSSIQNYLVTFKHFLNLKTNNYYNDKNV